MKRILQRIWFWIPCGLTCCAIVGLVAFATEEVRQVPKLQKRLDVLTNQFNDGPWLTNMVATNGIYSVLEQMDKSSRLEYASNYTTVEWVGKIVIAEDDTRYQNPIRFLRDCELGLRSDGVVVWREKK